MTAEAELLGAFEGHDPEGIRRVLTNGASATAPIDGKSPLLLLVEMYTRTSRFAECLRVMLDAGASFGDPLLEAILLDDASTLRAHLDALPMAMERRYDFACAYTPLAGASPLHLCAEYNAVQCARILLDAGHPIDARAAVDQRHFGGQTPLFHTVNSNRNYCRPMMELLVDAGAGLDVRLRGLVWGTGFEWETTIVDVTPLSYAQCGLYFQFHRREVDVYGNVAYLYERRYGEPLQVGNVPSKYLDDARVFPPRM